MIQTALTMIIVIFAATYLLFQLTHLKSQAKKTLSKKSCGCDGCPMASKK